MQTMHGDRRRGARYPIEWDGECRVRGGGYALGSFRDISRRGAFFHPETELLGIPHEGGEIPLLLRPGDFVFVTYVLSPSGREITTPAIVRWVGTSVDHGEFGAGLQLHGERFKS